MPIKSPCVYILASGRNGTLYVGVTSDIHGRMAQHAQKLVPSFTAKYGVTQLVYCEFHDAMDAAIRRESRSRNGVARGNCG